MGAAVINDSKNSGAKENKQQQEFLLNMDIVKDESVVWPLCMEL